MKLALADASYQVVLVNVFFYLLYSATIIPTLEDLGTSTVETFFHSKTLNCGNVSVYFYEVKILFARSAFITNHQGQFRNQTDFKNPEKRQSLHCVTSLFTVENIKICFTHFQLMFPFYTL